MAFACLFAPDLPWTGALREEPELRARAERRGVGLAIEERGRIVSGVLRGMRVAEALALRPALEVRSLRAEALLGAAEALLDVALSLSPRVERASPAELFCDLEGTQALFGSDRALLTALRARLERVGLVGVRIGSGPTRTVAALAARHAEGERSVRAHQVRGFLEGLSLDLLDPDDALALQLSHWGVRTLGQLARLPRRELGARLGRAGVDLACRARGEDGPPPPSARLPASLRESGESECAIGALEPLAFWLRALLDRLVGRLELRGLGVRALTLELGLESGARAVRELRTAAPTAETATLLALVRLALERDPPPEAVERAALIATAGRVEAAQLDLFRPPLPAPAELSVALARLETLCGPGRVGAPRLEDTHRPDAARTGAFAPSVAASRSCDAPFSARAPTLALRAVRPPRGVAVDVREGVPHAVALATGAAALRVRARAGPWRLFGEWWGESCFARDYFDVELSDGGLYRLYRELREDRWLLDGIYD